jgi:hypothetical protein
MSAGKAPTLLSKYWLRIEWRSNVVSIYLENKLLDYVEMDGFRGKWREQAAE